jgi:hypothetical protein
VTVRVGNAAQVFQRLLRLGVIVRPVAGYGMPEHLRVTIGTASENARFLDALGQSLVPQLDMPGKFKIGKLVVIGVGLIGGSFALALRKAACRQACRRCRALAPQPRHSALRLGIIDEIAMDAVTACAMLISCCWGCRWDRCRRSWRTSHRMSRSRRSSAMREAPSRT